MTGRDSIEPNVDHPDAISSQADAKCSATSLHSHTGNQSWHMWYAHPQLTRACGGIQVEVDIEGWYVCATHRAVHEPTPRRTLMTSRYAHEGHVVAIKSLPSVRTG